MAKTARNFNSEEDYVKWLKYGHMHGEFEKSPGNTPVKIKGKTKKVNHSKGNGAKSAAQMIAKARALAGKG